ncbi:MAG: CHAD domain-containing protein [Gammaproteobacteria bacterium]|nr:CHAD domain-containing protein [Gammaproteobacteria bacterium]
MNRNAEKHAHLDATLTVSEAIATILSQNLSYLALWEKTARTPQDIEGVHQIRVAFRRMRSALSIFRLAVPKKSVAPWTTEMRILAGELGKARDLDVFIDEVLNRIRDKLPLKGAEKLEALTLQHRDTNYGHVRAMLDSERYAQFKVNFGQWIEASAWEQTELNKKQRKRLEGSLIPFARKVLDRQERRVLEAGAHVDKHDAKDMHGLRIECKKLRYAAEFFSPLFPGLDEFIDHMKGLQELLGIMNDVAVTRGLLDTILQGVNDPEVSAYAGGIIGWRTCYYHELLYTFERRWDEFVEAKHPWWKNSATTAADADSVSSIGR